jgi:hypothetical protein
MEEGKVGGEEDSAVLTVFARAYNGQKEEREGGAEVDGGGDGESDYKALLAMSSRGGGESRGATARERIKIKCTMLVRWMAVEGGREVDEG